MAKKKGVGVSAEKVSLRESRCRSRGLRLRCAVAPSGPVRNHGCRQGDQRDRPALVSRKKNVSVLMPACFETLSELDFQKDAVPITYDWQVNYK